MQKRRIISKANYFEPRKCDNCGSDGDWVHLIAVDLSGDNEWLFKKQFVHICPKCYRDLKDHKYYRRDMV